MSKDTNKTDEQQAEFMLEGLKRGYRDELIREVLATLNPPGERGMENEQEVLKSLNFILTLFKPDTFWKAVDKAGLMPKKRDSAQSYGLFLTDRDDLIAIDVRGQSSGNFQARGEWEIKMIQNGYVKLLLKDSESQSIKVSAGDIIKSTGNIITIQNRSSTETETATATATATATETPGAVLVSPSRG
jgi:hypothetical protein